MLTEDPEAPTLTRQSSYRILDHDSLLSTQNRLIAQNAEILFVSPSEAALLLRHYGWKAKKLQAEWFENAKKVREAVGITAGDEGKILSLRAGQRVQCQSAYCDEVDVKDAHALSCGHWFCSDCWTAYLTSQINDGQKCIFAKCMGMRCTLDHAHKFGCACGELVPEAVFDRFITDARLLEKYKRWLLDSFVEGQRHIKWCPRPGCTFAVSYASGGTKAVQCACGHYFCFLCLEEAHTPAPCDLVKKWLVREKSDDATAIWLAAKTKECPKCQVRIEKNKACNHMTCIKCSFNFCWLCKGPWASHGNQTGGYYVCSKYDSDAKEGKVSSEERGIVENQKLLQKYSFYYKRFKGSADAIKITQKLGEKIEREMKDADLNKYSFLLEAIDKLIAARRILQWTYSLAYYLRNGGQKHLFEYQQEMLAGNTEALQDVMESNSLEKLLGQRKDIINKTSSMDKFRQEMVAQVERGEFDELLLSHADIGMDSWTCVNCFSSDSRLLTDRGFLFLHQVQQHLRHIRFACYNPSTQQLEYHHPLAFILKPTSHHPMIRFTPHDPLTPTASADVPLLVTPDHDMYVSRVGGKLEGDRGNGYHKVSASQLLGRGEGHHIRMLSSAVGGVQVDDTEGLPFIASLQLHTSSQVTAFLQLYGYWLANPTSTPFALTFTPGKDSSEWLHAMIADVGLREQDWYSKVSEDGIEEMSITAPQWLAFFTAEDGRQPLSPTASTSSSSLHSDDEDGDLLLSSPSDSDNESHPLTASSSSPHLPSWALNHLDRAQTRLLLTGFQRANDPHNTDPNTLYTSSPHMRDDLSMALIHAGYPASFSPVGKDGEGWRVSYGGSSELTLQCDVDVVESDYRGRVWCVSVPYGLLMAQRVEMDEGGQMVRGSRVVIAGNCKVDNKREAPHCVGCGSCKLHGEYECKACKVPPK